MSVLSALREELRAVDASERALRSFGRTVGGVFVLAAAAWAWIAADGGEPSRWAVAVQAFARVSGPSVLALAGFTLVVAGWAAPRRLARVHRAWMALALALGYVMTRVLLSAVFLAVVTPIGLVRRLFGHDPMHRRPDPGKETYWIRRPAEPPSPSSLEKYW